MQLTDDDLFNGKPLEDLPRLPEEGSCGLIPIPASEALKIPSGEGAESAEEMDSEAQNEGRWISTLPPKGSFGCGDSY